MTPRDRSIEVRTVEKGLWVRVRWTGKLGHFTVVEGDGSWVEQDEVDAWREVPHPSISIGSPRERG